MKTYKQALEDLKAQQEREIKKLKKHRIMFGIANRYAKLFGKSHKKMDVRVSYVSFEPAVDIDVDIDKDSSFKEVYPLIDMLIHDPRLEMHKPLPETVESKDTAITCSFKKKRDTSSFPLPKLRVYVHLQSSQVCVEVNTGKFREITRVACGYYDEEGNFVEDTDENNK